MGSRGLRSRVFPVAAMVSVLLVMVPGARGTNAASGRPSSDSPLGLNCRDLVSDDGVPFRKCNGRVASFDGLPLWTTVTLPIDAELPLPLVVLRHGSHSDGEAFHYDNGETLPPYLKEWNNVHFAKRGYAVLTSDARGWSDSCGPNDRLNPEFFAEQCQGRRYWVHAMDPRWEVRDVQTQIGLLVDEGWVNREAIGVYGFSMGAMETWLLALLGNRTMLPDGTLTQWRSPGGIPLRIAAAIPEAAFAAPAYGYAPNGRARDDAVLTVDKLSNPFGVVLEATNAGFCAFFPGTAELAPPGADPSADFVSWCQRLLQGNPFRADPLTDPVVARFLDEMRIRSALQYAPATPRVPIFLWQGLTDSITTGIHGVMMLNRLRALVPAYPVKAFFDDAGHPPASNTEEVYERLIQSGHDFFAYHLLGKGPPPVYDVTVSSPACAAEDRTKLTLTTRRWSDISTGWRTFASDVTQRTYHAGLPAIRGDTSVVDPGPLVRYVDPDLACTPVSVAETSGAAAWTFRVDDGFVLAGAPELTVRYTGMGTDPQIDVRLWDVSADGLTQKLISRGTYREEGTVSPKVLSFEIWPQVWRFDRGHALRLEITGNDMPYLQQNNTPFVLEINGVELRMPIVAQPAS